jgi:hypothetical protein
VPILPRLVAFYESRGIGIATGLNPSHFKNFPHAPFTWFVKDGASLTNGLGIALQEVYFLECLFARFHPKSVFAIGNSLGWSTLALALANPQARVLAIDAGFDRHSRAGIDFTNRVAAEEGLAVRAVIGKSPEDVTPILRDEAMPPVEFAFIDGYHAIEQVPARRPRGPPACRARLRLSVPRRGELRLDTGRRANCGGNRSPLAAAARHHVGHGDRLGRRAAPAGA